ncbi:hypothetical protein M0R04_08370 [Candidatus Dojkabacteria bacterium]|jgi:hypothetical protein|nr:hypothetical protein [Candidatus Dojkabacteria bacterium]
MSITNKFGQSFERFDEWATKHDWLLVIATDYENNSTTREYLTPNGCNVVVRFLNDRIIYVSQDINIHEIWK